MKRLFICLITLFLLCACGIRNITLEDAYASSRENLIKLLENRKREEINSLWGEPAGVVEGKEADVWSNGEHNIIIYYDDENVVSGVVIGDGETSAYDTSVDSFLEAGKTAWQNASYDKETYNNTTLALMNLFPEYYGYYEEFNEEDAEETLDLMSKIFSYLYAISEEGTYGYSIGEEGLKSFYYLYFCYNKELFKQHNDRILSLSEEAGLGLSKE